MIIGVVKEIKKYENRVALLPAEVESLVTKGHSVLVEKNAGLGINYSDKEYEANGATITNTAEEVYAKAEMILKVKEPQEEEYPLIRKDQILFTYFHFASSQRLTEAMIERRCIAIAYETIQDKEGTLPLLTPMSEIAGRMSILQAAGYLQKEKGGRGVLIGGVPGVKPATVLVLGGGAVGANAALMAAGLGAHTYILDINLKRLRYLNDVMPANVTTMVSSKHNILSLIKEADIVINGVLVPGAKAPMLITRAMLKTMKQGAVIVDVAIDQGGGLETSRPTDLENPTYIEEGVIHYCVTNMPGAVPMTSTIALTSATWPYIEEIANKGLCEAMRTNPAISHGINIVNGNVTHREVAGAFNLPYTPVAEAMKDMHFCKDSKEALLSY